MNDTAALVKVRPARLRALAIGAAAAVFMGASAALVLSSDGMRNSNNSAAIQDALPLAVLGDSDSQAFQDTLSFPPTSPKRGGAYRRTTFQWTEVLARMRGNEIDMGRWGVWGTRGRIAAIQDWLGLGGRAPRKQDYRNNFAISGEGCEALTTGAFRQAPRLLSLMDRTPERWRRGVVVVRIGVNNFGFEDSLDLLARDPQAPVVRAVMDKCVGYIRSAVELIHSRHPETRFVLVGIFDNSNWEKYFDRWQSPEALANIRAGLDRFDDSLRAMAAADPRLAFFDDRAWFAERWGTRGAHGEPAYRSVTLPSGFRVTNSAGDHPSHSVLADGHAGVVWNALWSQSLVQLINARWQVGITPISDAEIARFITIPATQGP